jgi:hypothetical protein
MGPSTAALCVHCNTLLANTSPPRCSPTPYLECTNVQPSADEKLKIQQALEDARNEISVVDEKIARLEDALAMLNSQRSDLQAFVDNHNAMISPARRLLPELWYEIFLECLSDHLDNDTDAIMFPRNLDTSVAPLLLTHVCSGWRQLALSSPRLWSSLALSLRPKSSSRCFLAQAWLKRSTGCPLTLRIDQPTGAFDGVPSAPVQSLLTDIITTSHRWLNVDLNLYIPSRFLEAFVAVKHELPILQRLAISFPQGGDAPNPYLTTFAVAPQLHTVHLGYGTSVELALPWHQLTHIVTESHSHIPVASHLELIKRSPNLVNYTATFQTVPNAGSMPNVRHPRLRVLTINSTNKRYHSDTSVPVFFSHLTLPSLHGLSITMSWSGLPPEFAAFILRSGCQIRHLILHTCKVKDAEYRNLLVLMPTLTRFHAKGFRLVDVMKKFGPRSVAVQSPADKASRQVLPFRRHG